MSVTRGDVMGEWCEEWMSGWFEVVHVYVQNFYGRIHW